MIDRERMIRPRPEAAWFSVPIGGFMERVNLFSYFDAGAVLRGGLDELKSGSPDTWMHLMIVQSKLEILLSNPVVSELPLSQGRGSELVATLDGSSGFLVDVRPTPAPSCSFCGTGIDHCAL